MPEPARSPAELIEQWLAITPAPAALRDLLAEFPLQVERNLMPIRSGFARDGQLWLDAGLVADSNRSPNWLLAVYLHEVAHCHLQRRGQGSAHNKQFAELAWALALRHGVAEWVDVGYDLHESQDDPGDVLAYAAAGAQSLAASGDPLAAADRRLWHNYSTFYNVFAVALAVAAVGLLLLIAGKANVLPTLPDLLRSDWAPRVAGLAVLAGAIWSAAR